MGAGSPAAIAIRNSCCRALPRVAVRFRPFSLRHRICPAFSEAAARRVPASRTHPLLCLLRFVPSCSCPTLRDSFMSASSPAVPVTYVCHQALSFRGFLVVGMFPFLVFCSAFEDGCETAGNSRVYFSFETCFARFPVSAVARLFVWTLTVSGPPSRLLVFGDESEAAASPALPGPACGRPSAPRLRQRPAWSLH